MTADQIEWWASLPRPVVVAAAALISTVTGEWLMLKSTYRDGWQLPGGIVERGESPREGCTREVLEEVGLNVMVGPLRSVDYRSPASGAAGPPHSLQFVFDGPSYETPPALTLQSEEIADAAWLPPQRAIELAIPNLAQRLRAIRDAAPGTCVYLENGEPP